MSFEFGDYVVEDNGYSANLGRFVGYRGEDAFVCYSRGAAAIVKTPYPERLRMATPDEVSEAEREARITIENNIGMCLFDSVDGYPKLGKLKEGA